MEQVAEMLSRGQEMVVADFSEKVGMVAELGKEMDSSCPILLPPRMRSNRLSRRHEKRPDPY